MAPIYYSSCYPVLPPWSKPASPARRVKCSEPTGPLRSPNRPWPSGPTNSRSNLDLAHVSDVVFIRTLVVNSYLTQRTTTHRYQEGEGDGRMINRVAAEQCPCWLSQAKLSLHTERATLLTTPLPSLSALFFPFPLRNKKAIQNLLHQYIVSTMHTDL